MDSSQEQAIATLKKWTERGLDTTALRYVSPEIQVAVVGRLTIETLVDGSSRLTVSGACGEFSTLIVGSEEVELRPLRDVTGFFPQESAGLLGDEVVVFTIPSFPRSASMILAEFRPAPDEMVN